ncbi:5-methyltetrahydropteroyltriglutamate--homocysteine S-methyltransferase [Maridesulfovibrio hydrothermalis]|uniref:5-methyltetrahydropteroyltriglutamate--homocysteine methyltransferase n=1 Tax=Maridesulfovibrio hydrothermalis AM13 = DSM 14728 TaxID=1121451 RepID=L0R9X4_9BACT|nr:5-methyltetrahydropteroyltriglutamate--homocysteine S-methyltransferase [Maridesulfovibrio hydrothermalis]CCO22381.1 5-methyltetrahydropteroyltriglutamate-homocysteine S-methyltransferase [Maridesulfovibrio hydrothermalis AM13 = DSM 14728]
MLTHTLGYPRMGSNRELKKKLEAYWRGEAGADDLALTAKKLRLRHWNDQAEAGVDLIPVGDFSYYDHMLDNAVRFGVIPERYNVTDQKASLDDYFKMARGQSGENGVPAMEMTKWFDTNYHYIVPELREDQTFCVADESLLEQINEAVTVGHKVKAVLPGPLTFLLLGKCADQEFDRLTLLEKLIPAYVEFLGKISDRCAWIQFDEPILALDLDEEVRKLFGPVYRTFKESVTDVKIMVASYFGGLGSNLEVAAKLPVDALHVDLVRGGQDLEPLLEKISDNLSLSLGVVDGRNIWRADLDKAIARVKSAQATLGSDRILVAPSCSLLHVPFDLDLETKLDDEIKSWMAFARQKCGEIKCIADGAGGKDVEAVLAQNRKALESRKNSSRTNNLTVAKRLASLKPEDYQRKSPYLKRAEIQRAELGFPILPTTTIGSFPQTAEVRATRSSFKNGRIGQAEYEKFMHNYIADCIARQEAIGLDVLVHGEPERNDMVEYFGENFDGYCFTSNGWVQSYGSRCVKPPVVYGDVSRPAPITVDWINYARSLSSKEVKGMLTGPVTILCWSFVRDDQPRSVTCRQIALAVRDEVADLEKSGVKVIQIDEPALREGLPLRRSEQQEYLKWAEECFRLSASCVEDATQIHTHMCYCEFDEIINSIAALDADVISIEASRSRMELLGSFKQFSYPNEVGPGVYDIHSPAIPDADEMAALLEKALEVIPAERLWVNPDCGLKTRKWDEVEPSLRNMVQAAAKVRQKI